jgi:hypothetical protein
VGTEGGAARRAENDFGRAVAVAQWRVVRRTVHNEVVARATEPSAAVNTSHSVTRTRLCTRRRLGGAAVGFIVSVSAPATYALALPQDVLRGPR